jgi:hypothetical protein
MTAVNKIKFKDLRRGPRPAAAQQARFRIVLHDCLNLKYVATKNDELMRMHGGLRENRSELLYATPDLNLRKKGARPSAPSRGLPRHRLR